MTPLRALLHDSHFRRGARDMLDFAPGIAAWALVTGVAMAKTPTAPPCVASQRWAAYTKARATKGNNTPSNTLRPNQTESSAWWRPNQALRANASKRQASNQPTSIAIQGKGMASTAARRNHLGGLRFRLMK